MALSTKNINLKLYGGLNRVEVPATWSGNNVSIESSWSNGKKASTTSQIDQSSWVYYSVQNDPVYEGDEFALIVTRSNSNVIVSDVKVDGVSIRSDDDYYTLVDGNKYYCYIFDIFEHKQYNYDVEIVIYFSDGSAYGRDVTIATAEE